MTTRREFLTAAPLRDALQPAADDLTSVPIAGNTIRLGKAAMASDFEVILNPGDGSLLAAASDALDEIDRLEEQLSIYRSQSELSQLNSRAADGPVVVEPRLFELLRQTIQYAREFEGAYDPTAGPLVALWRRCRRERRIPTSEEILHARSHLGSALVEFDLERQTVRFHCPGIELNLNAIGKGYALDRAAEILLAARNESEPHDSADESKKTPSSQNLISSLHASGGERSSDLGSPENSLPSPLAGEGSGMGGANVSGRSSSKDQFDMIRLRVSPPGDSQSVSLPPPPSFLIHGGHSSILARGNRAGMDGWPVAIRHPLIPNRTLATVRLKDRAMSTSGSAVQFFRVGDRRYGHILDPRTGWPAEGILAATVFAPTAAQAEALSTAFFVAGVEKAREYCHNQTDVAALIVPAPAGRQSLEPVAFGIPEGDLLWDSEG
jgi:thiamine biosynthesis lipoprotein ApbE